MVSAVRACRKRRRVTNSGNDCPFRDYSKESPLPLIIELCGDISPFGVSWFEGVKVDLRLLIEDHVCLQLAFGLFLTH